MAMDTFVPLHIIYADLFVEKSLTRNRRLVLVFLLQIAFGKGMVIGYYSVILLYGVSCRKKNTMLQYGKLFM